MSSLTDALIKAGLKPEAVPELEKVLQQEISRAALKNISLEDTNALATVLATKEDLAKSTNKILIVLISVISIAVAILHYWH